MDYIEYGNADAPIVLVQPVGDHDSSGIENEISVIREYTGMDFRLIALKVRDWNRELSPWKAPAVFGKEDFGDGASETLAEILKLCEDITKSYYIGGYSLAGLFALWAAYQTDRFRGVAAASPSMWFPGFTEYMKEHEIRSGHVYLSIGDKEEKTRNAIMATVGDRIREAYALLTEQQVDCLLEWNEGNHFRDADLRTAKAFSRVMKGNNDVKWIFFDLGATLVDESDVYKSRCEYAIRQAGIEPTEFMDKVCEMARISPTPIGTAARSYGVTLPEWDNSLEKLYETAPKVVSGLHKKYKLGIIANQTIGTQERIDTWGIGEFFDVVMASAEAGCAKPDPRLFTMALQKAGCEPCDAIMVGDRLDNDIVPAKKLGMKTIWVRQGYAVYQSIDDESKRPDHMVDSIEELLELFEKNDL